MKQTKKEQLARRHRRVRRKVAGTEQRPRVFVRKSLKHLYVQVVDDSPEKGSRTLAAYSTSAKSNAGKHSANVAGATELGKSVGNDLKAKGIASVVFDRGGYRYHGVVKAIAEAVRESGVTI
ncbi:50S ribosomal protein L18 [soil metagenome]